MRHILLLLIIVISLFISSPERALTDSALPVGPNIDRLVVKEMPQLGITRQLEALKTGEINLISKIGSGEASELSAYPDTRITEVQGGTVAYLFFNMRRSPCSELEFRKAISRIVNREYICDTIAGNEVDPLTSFIPLISGDWVNEKALAPRFDSMSAAKILDNAGYLLDSTSGWRINPVTDKVLEFTILTPLQSENPVLWGIGYTVNYYANALGIRSVQQSLSMGQFMSRVMEARDFDICVQYVPMNRVPFGLYVMFDSSRDMKGTSAFSGIHDEDLDYDLRVLWSGLEESKLKEATQSIQAKLQTLLPCVPVLSVPIVSAVDANWVGAVGVPGYGIDNLWTYLSIHPTDQMYGGTLTKSVLGSFSTLNPCVVNSTNEWGILQLIYSPLMYFDPVTGEDIPMLAQSWKAESWTTPKRVDGMKATIKLRSNVQWQDGFPFTSQDVKFCIDYLTINNVPRYKDTCNKIEKVETPDDATVVVYFNEPGYRLLYSLNWFTFMPEHIWSGVPDYKAFEPWSETNPNVQGLTKLVGHGPYIFSKCDLGDYVELVWNPFYFLKNPERPGLVEVSSAPTTATIGDILTFSYNVKNQMGAAVNIGDPSFKLTYPEGR